MKEIYNDIYSRQSSASRKRRIPFYLKLAENILPKDNVLDIGCGNGMLPYLSTWEKYIGYDISEVAIEQAKIRCPKADFICGEFSKKNKVKYNTVVMTEFLEHIENDIEILSLIKKDSKVIISVPNEEPLIDGKPRGYPTHKRSYNVASVKKRYKDIKFKEIFVFENWIIAVGLKK